MTNRLLTPEEFFASVLNAAKAAAAEVQPDPEKQAELVVDILNAVGASLFHAQFFKQEGE